MDTALAALNRGVRALFSVPLDACSSHPLCECSVLQPPPPEWRYLLRYPVLKRQLMTQWSVVAAESRSEPLTPRKKRQKRSLNQQNYSSEVYKTQGLAALCHALAQCNLLTAKDAELMQSVVASASLEMLQLVITGKILPLRLRVILLGFVLQSQERNLQELAVQNWIQTVCEKVLEEALEAMAQTTAGKKSVDSNEEKTVSDEEKSCVFCRQGASAEPLRSKSEGWGYLVECAQRIVNLLEKSDSSATKVIGALSALQNGLTTTNLVANVRTGQRRRRAELLVKIDKHTGPSLSIPAYTRICQMVTESPVYLRGVDLEKFEATKRIWVGVWKREFERFVGMNHIALADAIRHCSKCDAFASVIRSAGMSTKVSESPGFRVVLEVVRSLFVDVPGSITAFAQVWSDIGSDFCEISSYHCVVPRAAETSMMRRILRSYLSKILVCSNVRGQEESPSLSTQMQSPELLFFLYEIFADSALRDKQHESYAKQWDILMSQSREGSANTQNGMSWCLALERYVIGADAIEARCKAAYRDGFLLAFRNYCLGIVHRIVATDGEMISSGGSIQCRLMCVEADRLAVRRLLTVMMTTFGQNWISNLIVTLLRAHTSLLATKEISQRGIKSLLFPALVSCMKSSSRSNQNRRRSGQHQFIEVICRVNSVLKDSEPTPLYLVALIRFCESWDVYQCTHTKEPPSKTDRWGFRAMINLDVLPQLLQCYGADDAVYQETKDVLNFAAEVLQNVTNCPPALEGDLFRVLSIVKAGAENGGNCAPRPHDGKTQLVSHSNELLNRLLCAVKVADSVQTRQLMEQINETVGTLDEFKQQLERWFSCVDTHGASFIGKESRLELSLLCIRLIRWFPSEFESLRLLMSPLDSHLVFSLQSFVKDAGRSGNAAERGLVFGSSVRSSLTSVVRIEMALHLYISATVFPDLETLTVQLTKAMVKCRSSEAFEHIAKVVRKIVRMLLPEVAISTLKAPLRGLEFSSVASIYQDGDEEGAATEFEKRARRTKSIIYQQNVLKMLTAPAPIFEGELPWSMVLFDGISAVVWLPYFFEFVMRTEFCEGIVRINQILTALEELARTKSGEKALHRAFWVAALLNTALLACSGRNAGSYSHLEKSENFRERLQAITRKALLLLYPVEKEVTTLKSNVSVDTPRDANRILALLSRSKCAWIMAKEGGVYQNSEYVLSEKSAQTLQSRFPEMWGVGTTEPPTAGSERPIQLLMPFSPWLEGALVYSQSFLEEPSATMTHWERTFISYVTDVYLPLEFEDNTCRLLGVWLHTWISCNIVRGQEDKSLLALLPSQVALFRRLGLSPYRGSFVRDTQAKASVWKLVFVGINLAVSWHASENSIDIDQATELIASTLTTLELVDLSAASDFEHCSRVQDLEPYFAELEKSLANPQLRSCSAAQVFYLLQYSLELLVCCYACKFRDDHEAASISFLQRVDKALRETFGVRDAGEHRPGSAKEAEEGEVQDGEANHCSDEKIYSSSMVLVESNEMDAFLESWRDEMLLKYDYLNRERCAKVLETIEVALRGGLLAQMTTQRD